MQGVQAFPTNVTLQRFLELHIEITGELPDPTSGQTMERCGVCSEKSYCSLCVHCEKKCCPECKDAHMDILRREITRINSQVREIPRRSSRILFEYLAPLPPSGSRNSRGTQTKRRVVVFRRNTLFPDRNALSFLTRIPPRRNRFSLPHSFSCIF